MPASPSSSAQAARQRLGAQLRDMRTAARISGLAFARIAGWRSSGQVTMIEKGQRTITADHVRLWCQICGASQQRTQELLAEQATVASTWTTYRQLNRVGLSGAQKSVREVYEQVRLMRVYVTHVMPGLLQTEAYTTAALESARAEQQVELDDVAAAVAERMDRQTVLHRPDARFVFLLEEQVLRYRTVPAEVQREQLAHLAEVMRMPSVSVGIIPLGTDRSAAGLGVWPEHSFTLVDSERATAELVSGYLSVTQPAEVADYIRAWDRLFPLAVHGKTAAALIQAAMGALG